jgi:hypothetical protein
MRLFAGIAFAVAAAASISPAMAQSTVETGVLDCRGRTQSFILASTTELQCVYESAAGGRAAYAGTMRLFGVDVQINQSVAMRWAVFAPTHRVGPADLVGHYVGASANATIGVGIGANALFGGSHNTISLQPLGVQGQIGLGAAGGISSLDLVSVGRYHGPRRHHRHHRRHHRR